MRDQKQTREGQRHLLKISNTTHKLKFIVKIIERVLTMKSIYLNRKHDTSI